MPSLLADTLLKMIENMSHVSHVEKPWGEEWCVSTSEFLLKVIRVDAGCRTSLQKHEAKDEVIVLLEGEGRLDGGRGSRTERRPALPRRMLPGDVHRATGPLLMIELSTNHPHDVVRLDDDYHR